MRALLDRELDMIAGGLIPVGGGNSSGGGASPPPSKAAQTFTSPPISGNSSPWSSTVTVGNDSWNASLSHDAYHGTYSESLSGKITSQDKLVSANATLDNSGHWNGGLNLNYGGNQLSINNAGQTSFSHDFGNGISVNGNYLNNSTWSIGLSDSHQSGAFRFDLGGSYGSGGYSMNAGFSYNFGY